MARPQLEKLPEGGWSMRGDLTFATVADFLTELSEQIADSEGCATFDLSEVGRADSAGLALLLEGMAMAKGKGCEVEYRNLPDNLRDLARISNVERLFGL